MGPVTAAYHDIIVLTAAWLSIEALRTQAPGGRTAALESTDPNHQGILSTCKYYPCTSSTWACGPVL